MNRSPRPRPAPADPAMPAIRPRSGLTIRAGKQAESACFCAQNRSHLRSREAMEQLVAIGMEEGMTAAVAQIDDGLAPARVRPHLAGG